MARRIPWLLKPGANIMHRTTPAIVGLSLLFATGPALRGKNPPVPKKAESLTSILERIRQDVGYYEVQAARRRNLTSPPHQSKAMPDTPAPGVLPAAACDIRDFDFDVTNVQANLQTVTMETENWQRRAERAAFRQRRLQIDADANWQTPEPRRSSSPAVSTTAHELASYQSSKGLSATRGRT